MHARCRSAFASRHDRRFRIRMYRVSASIHDIAKCRAADTCGIPSRRSIQMRRILTTFAARPAHPAPAFARYRAYRSIDSPSGFRHEDLKDHLRACRVCYRSLRPCSGPRRFVDGESRCRRHDPMDTGHCDADGKDAFRSTSGARSCAPKRRARRAQETLFRSLKHRCFPEVRHGQAQCSPARARVSSAAVHPRPDEATKMPGFLGTACMTYASHDVHRIRDLASTRRADVDARRRAPADANQPRHDRRPWRSHRNKRSPSRVQC